MAVVDAGQLGLAHDLAEGKLCKALKDGIEEKVVKDSMLAGQIVREENKLLEVVVTAQLHACVTCRAQHTCSDDLLPHSH